MFSKLKSPPVRPSPQGVIPDTIMGPVSNGSRSPTEKSQRSLRPRPQVAPARRAVSPRLSATSDDTNGPSSASERFKSAVRRPATLRSAMRRAATLGSVAGGPANASTKPARNWKSRHGEHDSRLPTRCLSD